MDQASLRHLWRVCIWVIVTISALATTQVQATTTRNFTSSEMTLQSAIKRTIANTPDLHEFTFKQEAIEGEIKTASRPPRSMPGLK
jgi:cobalt-zinc-cadmium efflux system outer membrane protein